MTGPGVYVFRAGWEFLCLRGKKCYVITLHFLPRNVSKDLRKLIGSYVPSGRGLPDPLPGRVSQGSSI